MRADGAPKEGAALVVRRKVKMDAVKRSFMLIESECVCGILND
jgi:hypothetical protein